VCGILVKTEHRDTIKRKLIKLLALARAGEGGERENARTPLERLMHKYQFELTDLERGTERGTERIMYTLVYTTEWENACSVRSCTAS
jgi:hypothetical protein